MINANTVILFPADHIIRINPSEISEDDGAAMVFADVEVFQKRFINNLIQTYIDSIIYSLIDSNIDISSDDFQKNFAFTMECLRASIYQTMGLRHPLHGAITSLIESIINSSKKSDS